MSKIPVGRTISFAYAFLFHEIGAIVGITWLPAVVYAASDAAMRLFAASGSGSVEESVERNFPVLIAASLAMLAARSVAAVGIARHVLGMRQGGARVAVPLDRTVLRMFAANIRFFLGAVVLVVLASLISALAFQLAGVPLDAPEQAEGSIAATIAAILSLSLFAYALMTILKMGFLLPAVVVAEPKGGLVRSHALIERNFWRMVAVLLGLGLPVFLLFLAGEIAVIGSAAVSGDLSQEDARTLMEQAEAAIRRQLVSWEIFMAVLFVLASGLIYSGAAFAYGVLTGHGTESAQIPQ